MNAILARTPTEIARWVLYVGLVLAGLACLVASAFMGRDDLWGPGLLLIGYAVPAFNTNKTRTQTEPALDLTEDEPSPAEASPKTLSVGFTRRKIE